MFSKALLTTALISAVSAHQNWHQLWINDETPGFEVGIRMPPSNSPVVDVKSNDMACNVPSTNGVKVTTVEAKEGDTIKVKWDSSSHPGPITHFLLPVEDAATATGAGAGWFKIDEVNNVDGKWANEIMMAKEMTHEFKLPTGLKSGEYLLRSEMLALHGAQTVGGAQFYIGCAQLKITGTGSGSCGPTISIPGAYDENDENIYIPNVYNGFDVSTYKAPGGDVATCGAGSGTTPSTPTTSKPAASSAAASAPVASATPSPSAVAEAKPSAPAASSAPAAPSAPVASASPSASAAPAPGAGAGGSSGSLPAKFTLDTFITWLEGKAAGSAKARRHAREF